MKLRNLDLQDAEGMIEWMSNPNINQLLHFNSNQVSMKSAKVFIRESQNKTKNLHLAITDETNEYLGTVSLKNIDEENHNAEFAIALRQCAMGHGISKFALNAILDIAFHELELHRVYLYVRMDNIRAIKFYEKCHLRDEGIFVGHYCIDGVFKDLKWYAILSDEYDVWKLLNNIE